MKSLSKTYVKITDVFADKITKMIRNIFGKTECSGFCGVPLVMAALILLSLNLCGCAAGDENNFKGAKNAEETILNGAKSAEEGASRITIVSTIFPGYDFARNIVGDNADVYQLLKPGAESHSYEPTPQDIILIKNCDIFIYPGGESDAWLETILESAEVSDKCVISMLDTVKPLGEEEKEGMREGGILAEYFMGEAADEDAEWDEHVWTSPVNAIAISQAICERLCEIDTAGSEIYRKNCDNYVNKLCKLDKDMRDQLSAACAKSGRNTIVVADRFPFRYLCEEYGLDYYGAFPGCSEDAEITASSLIFLSDKVFEDKIPVVFYIEFSNEKIADSICEVTGAKKSLLHSCHNVSAKEIKEGHDYISIMYDNLSALKEALL